MMRLQGTVARGAVAGLIGAAVLATWFLIIDTVQNAPFHTPTFVANTLLDMQGAPTTALLAIYTVLHFAAFVVVGVAVAWLLDKAGLRPLFLLGLVLGFLLFDLIFYAGVIMTGTNVVRELGWPEVLIGNMLAGISLMGYLAYTSDIPPVRLSDMLRDHTTIREGLVAGLAGAIAVMLWFFIFDVVKGRPLFTPGALGSALFLGARGVSQVQVGMETVLGYTGVHLVSFIIVGLIASALIEGARREPHVLLALVLLFVTLEVIFIGVLAVVAAWLLEAIQWWMIIAGNLIAAAAMGGYLLWRHPEVRENLKHDLEEELAQ
ncbi:MAG: hypothetical protein ACT4O1_02965 [Gemmatimonadota bacterium]